MALNTVSTRVFAPDPRSYSIDITPILLTVHLLGLVAGIALTVGLIPVAIVLLRAVL